MSFHVCLPGHATQVAAALHTFFLAMLLYPDIQARARRELETALGADHLPSFEDFGSVPYIDALIRELLRWRPVLHLSKFLKHPPSRGAKDIIDIPSIAKLWLADIPHKLQEDDNYKGYHLEKDSLVIVNIW